MRSLVEDDEGGCSLLHTLQVLSIGEFREVKTSSTPRIAKAWRRSHAGTMSGSGTRTHTGAQAHTNVSRAAAMRPCCGSHIDAGRRCGVGHSGALEHPRRRAALLRPHEQPVSVRAGLIEDETDAAPLQLVGRHVQAFQIQPGARPKGLGKARIDVGCLEVWF